MSKKSEARHTDARSAQESKAQAEKKTDVITPPAAAAQPLLNVPKDLAVSERGFLFDPRTGLTYTLNATGHFILQALQKGTTQEALVGELTTRYETTPQRASEDLRDFLQQLKDFGLGT